MLAKKTSAQYGIAVQANKSENKIIHGGDLQQASLQYGIAVQDWIDLSTGLNPAPYKVKDIPVQVFSELPYIRDDFLDAAKKYYGCSHLLALNGTQVAIQALPKLLKKVGIILPSLGYQEHFKHWQQWGEVNGYYDSNERALASTQITNAIKENPNQHLLIINPNNPSGLMFSKEQINQWARALNNDCQVIVDEAFMDLTPQHSILEEDMAANMIVLRSFGKFFGLAGIRLGFLFAESKLITQLERHLGLWNVNGPAQHIAIQALTDKAWHLETIDKIAEKSLDNKMLFSPLFSCPTIILIKEVHTGLFSSYWLDENLAKDLFGFFAMHGILLRLIPMTKDICVIRIGLPDIKNNDNILRIKKAIKDFLTNV